MDSKKCKACGVVKPISDFFKARYVHTHCKTCVQEQHRQKHLAEIAKRKVVIAPEECYYDFAHYASTKEPSTPYETLKDLFTQALDYFKRVFK